MEWRNEGTVPVTTASFHILLTGTLAGHVALVIDRTPLVAVTIPTPVWRETVVVGTAAVAVFPGI